MNQRQIILIILLCIAGFFAYRWFGPSMVQKNGKTAKEVSQLAPAVPDSVAKKLSDQNSLLKQLREIDGFTDDALKKEFNLNNAALEKAKFKNLSSSNYDFKLPNSDYLVSIPLAESRRNNYIVLLGKEALLDQEKLTDKQFKKIYEDFKTAEVPTYQGISRAATAQRLRTAQKSGVFNDSIVIPQTYLAVYADIKEGEHPISDQTHFIVQDYIDSKILDAAGFNELTVEQIKELIKAAWAGYLWNFSNSIGLTKDGKLFLANLEQPDRFNPANFYLKNESRAQIFAINGLKDLLNMLKGHKDYGKIAEFVQSYFMADKFIKNEFYPQDHFNKTIKPLLNK